MHSLSMLLHFDDDIMGVPCRGPWLFVFHDTSIAVFIEVVHVNFFSSRDGVEQSSSRDHETTCCSSCIFSVKSFVK